MRPQISQATPIIEFLSPLIGGVCVDNRSDGQMLWRVGNGVNQSKIKGRGQARDIDLGVVGVSMAFQAVR